MSDATNNSGAVAVRTAENGRELPAIRTDADGNIPPSQLIMAALERGVNPDSLEKLVALQERMEDRNARKEFAAALAAFKRECPPVFKTKSTKTAGSSRSFDFTWAPLEDIVATIDPYLEKHGFTYKWDRTADGKGMLTSVCTLRHIAGHSETSSFTLPTESSNPGMSTQHKYSGAATFADRKSLQAVLGIVSDDQERAAQREIDPTPVTEDQLTDLEDRITVRLQGKTPQKAAAWRKNFLEHFGIESLAQLPAVRYQEALVALQPKEGA